MGALKEDELSCAANDGESHITQGDGEATLACNFMSHAAEENTRNHVKQVFLNLFPFKAV